MNKFRYTLFALAIFTFMLVVSSSAQAQTRTWVSGVGNDANPCSRTAPCKTYAGAISKTAKDGEISTLDPGGFGAVTITKSITINGGGGGQGYGSILAALTTGIIINITDAGDVRKSVRLDGLNINGVSTGTDGIRFIAGNVLHVSNTTIDGFTGDGIDVNVSTANVQVIVENTRLRNCVATGIRVNGTNASQVRAHITNSYITRNGIGVDFVNGVRGTINESTVSNNTGHGLQVAEPTVGSNMGIIATTISHNNTGVNVVGTAKARIARCNIFENVTSLSPAASVDSGGNNSIAGNNNNTAPAGPAPFPQN